MIQWSRRRALSVLLLLGWLTVLAATAPAKEQAKPLKGKHFYVSPSGDDRAAGTKEAPFRTLLRAQAAIRAAAPAMAGDLIVNLAAGLYRLSHTFELTEADSGHNGHRVVYRSADGLGRACLSGSVPLVGWKEHRNGIWKIELPESMVFHTLYENGRRAWKARFPNYEHHPDMPTARGRYLVTEDGMPKPKRDAEPSEKKGPGWLVYHPGDEPPVLLGSKAKILIFAGGKCDWMRQVHGVVDIDRSSRRLTFDARVLPWGVAARARYFLEDDLAFLDAPGEFYLDEKAHTLFYMPMGKGHPDKLAITAPVLRRLIQIQGKSRDTCARNLTLEGLTLEQTDGFPMGWWSTQWGRRDGALIWMGNTQQIEVRNCHLRHSGRNGIMMIGHNLGNLITGCRIEHMGLNGVTLCNRFSSPDRKAATPDRCEHNRVLNCHVHDIGEIHTYAACVNLFNVSHNEIGHCELHDSVRYAVTVRGNTGAQYGPPVWTAHPGAKDNRIHHLRVYRCGQDGGDMGALHCANLNNPDGDCINTFEQITIADSRAIPSMQDIGPDGIFLDWPKMAMHQVFHHLHIVRCQGLQIRSNRPDNAASAQTENVSWEAGFREEKMDYENIGLTAEFPAEFGGRPPVRKQLLPPNNVNASAVNYDTVTLQWDAPPRADKEGVVTIYTVFRNNEKIGQTKTQTFTDHALAERTEYSYQVRARCDDFRKPSVRSAPRRVRTPPDLEPPCITGARVMPDRKRVRVAFSEAVDPVSAVAPGNYRFDPPLVVAAVKLLTPDCVELQVQELKEEVAGALTIVGIRDVSVARNVASKGKAIPLGASDVVVAYPLERVVPERLRDVSGGGGDARLHGGAVVEPSTGPFGGASLQLDGKSGFAQAPEDLNLGDGDFTIMVWIYRLGSGVILSKGNGFSGPSQWSLGWQESGVPASVSLRVRNQFFSTAAGAIPNGQWVHVAFVKDGNTGQAYVNGGPSGKAHDLSELGPFINDRPLLIGCRNYEPNPAFFRGKIAGVVVMSRASSAADIRAHATGKER